jgi:hypothetical protein
MPPVDRRNPIRAASSESTCSLLEFAREFPDDESCLTWLWRERFASDGETRLLLALRQGEGLQALRHGAEAPLLVLPDVRIPHPPAQGNDLRAVVHVAPVVVLRHVPHG